MGPPFARAGRVEVRAARLAFIPAASRRAGRPMRAVVSALQSPATHLRATAEAWGEEIPSVSREFPKKKPVQVGRAPGRGLWRRFGTKQGRKTPEKGNRTGQNSLFSPALSVT